MTKWLPTADYLRECFCYDPATGVLTWKARPVHHFRNEARQRWWNGQHAGTKAGTPNPEGHVHIILKTSHNFMAHRLIWFMMMGEWPEQIDHKNGDPADNRLSNLRAATRQQNRWNRPHIGKLPRGVWPSRYGPRYQAYVCINKEGKHTSKYLGTYDTPESAHAAWCAAAREQRGEFFRAG